MKNSYLVSYTTGTGFGMINIHTNGDLKYSDLKETRHIIFKEVIKNYKDIEIEDIIILNIVKMADEEMK